MQLSVLPARGSIRHSGNDGRRQPSRTPTMRAAITIRHAVHPASPPVHPRHCRGRQPGWPTHPAQSGHLQRRDLQSRGAAVELVGLGYRFQSSHSDTEVLVHGYDAWARPRPAGSTACSRSRSSTAAAAVPAWDRLRSCSIMSDGEVFAFASEIQALLRHPGEAPDPIPSLQLISPMDSFRATTRSTRA